MALTALRWSQGSCDFASDEGAPPVAGCRPATSPLCMVGHTNPEHSGSCGDCGSGAHVGGCSAGLWQGAAPLLRHTCRMLRAAKSGNKAATAA